eukprot:390430-Amphidinium_carterae.1
MIIVATVSNPSGSEVFQHIYISMVLLSPIRGLFAEPNVLVVLALNHLGQEGCAMKAMISI